MSEEVQQPYDLDEFICLIGEKPNLSQPNPLSIEDYLKVAKQNNENNKTETILKTWENQQTAERKRRKTYANCFMWFLGLQLLALNIIFF